MRTVVIYHPGSGEISCCTEVQLPLEIAREKATESDWQNAVDAVIDAVAASGMACIEGCSKPGDMVVDGALVPRPAAPESLDSLRAKAASAIDVEYGRATQAISAGYPAEERESWPVQTSEARALLADADAVTPWIDAAAHARSLTRLDLAQRIVALDNTYRAVHGRLSGLRQALQLQIAAAATPAAIRAVTWPATTPQE